MKKILAALLLLSAVAGVRAQDKSTTTNQYYHPGVDAQHEIDSCLILAKAQHKHVLLMIGGNWCRWCRMFQAYVDSMPKLDSTLNANYIELHVNYSKEDKNLPLLAKLGYPQRFGYPVFVILDAGGNRLNTQNSAYLEKGEGYSEEKVLEFFKQWGPGALEPAQYSH